jgi:hypothetical protein
MPLRANSLQVDFVSYLIPVYRNHRVLMEQAQHCTRFIGLASVGNAQKEKWIYAFNLKPMKSLPRAELTKQPEVTSEFPYMDVLQEYVET